VGSEAADDAAVFSFCFGKALVLTVDCLTPLHDDPYVYGQIACANSLSDVYAMGGRPMVALNVVGWPADKLPLEMLERMLKGAADKAEEAGVCIGGGHTIQAPEPFYGLAVVGEVDPAKVVRNGGARVGDKLVLTKPLGVGIIVTAGIADIADECALAKAAEQMTMLNRGASEAMVRHGAHAATDITGFGLAGHAHEMAEASGVEMRIRFRDVSVLDEALDYARQWCIPGGLTRNREYYGKWVETEGLAAEQVCLVFDPQTSGGLLIAAPVEEADGLLAEVREAGCTAAIVGEVVEGQAGRVRVE
jgi:selenide,water dikinase